MLQILHSLGYFLQPILVPICFMTAWALIILLLLNTWITVRDGFSFAKRLHDIPCPDCQFFTGDYRLKCTIHPTLAATEEAINCRDFCPKNK